MEKTYITMTATFALSDELTLLFKNASLDFFDAVDVQSINELFNIKWYMYGAYDVVTVFNEKYVITVKTKKKVELVRYIESSNQ
jgi:hypothetical protein